MAAQGFVAPGFESVKRLFEERYVGGKHGATFAVYHKGVKVVSLWCGYRGKKLLYQEDSLANVFSATKGMSALCLAILVSLGKVKYSDKVSKYWPEFAAEGKGDMTIGQMASHQGGLCALREDVPIEDFLVEGRVAAKLAAQKPWWTPGEQSGYHPQLSGFLIGELVKRTTGLTLGNFFRQHVADPFGIDFHIGLPEEHEGRVAQMAFVVPKGSDYAGGLSVFGDSDMQKRAFEPNPYGILNTREWRAAELGSINGQSNGHALARIYGALANDCMLDGKQVLNPSALAEARTVQMPGAVDCVLDQRMQWAMGFMVNPLESPYYGPNPESFGHPGFGGHVGFADPHEKLGIGFVRNGIVIETHSLHHLDLVKEVYACIGKPTSKL